MHRMGLLEPVYRLPMVPPTDASKQKIDDVLESLSLREGAAVASRH